MRLDCHIRKFLKSHYFSDEACKRAALEYESKCQSLLNRFDILKGKGKALQNPK